MPELTAYGAGQLYNSKYYGTAGMEALRAILKHADQYGLRYIFVRDRYYEPLLAFAGWRQAESYDNGAISLWTKDDVPPAKHSILAMPCRPWEGMMWGLLPVGASLFASSSFLIPERRRRSETIEFPARPEREVSLREATSMSKILPVLLILLAAALIAAATMHSHLSLRPPLPKVPSGAMLDTSRPTTPQAHIATSPPPATLPEDFARDLFGQDSNLRTYSALQQFDTKVLSHEDDQAVVRASLQWASAVGAVYDTRDLQVVREDNSWSVMWPVQPPPRFRRR